MTQNRTTTTRTTNPDHVLHQRFLAILPRIEAHGRVYFRNVRCQDKREDAIAEMTALSYHWFRRLVSKGKQPDHFVSAIASFAAKAVNSGRRLCGQERAKDVLSPRAQRRHGFAVGKLPEFSTLSGNPLTDALIDNTITPPDQQAAFRIDFADWLGSLDERKRRIAEDMMLGERTLDLADKHKLSPGRISQLRRDFMDDWERFTEGEIDD